jgi:hypothetical protein
LVVFRSIEVSKPLLSVIIFHASVYFQQLIDYLVEFDVFRHGLHQFRDSLVDEIINSWALFLDKFISDLEHFV